MSFVVALLGYEVLKIPLIVAHGWPEAAPTTLLMGVVSPDPQTPWGKLMMRVPAGSATSTGVEGWWAACNRRFAESAWARVADGRAWGWQSRWLLARALWRDQQKERVLVVVPPRWPMGEPIPVFVAAAPAWTGHYGINSAVLSGKGRWETEGIAYMRASDRRADEVSVRVALVHAGHRLWTDTVSRPIVIEGIGEDCLIKERSDDANKLARDALSPMLRIADDGFVGLFITDRADTAAWTAIDFGVCRGSRCASTAKPSHAASSTRSGIGPSRCPIDAPTCAGSRARTRNCRNRTRSGRCGSPATNGSRGGRIRNTRLIRSVPRAGADRSRSPAQLRRLRCPRPDGRGQRAGRRMSSIFTTSNWMVVLVVAAWVLLGAGLFVLFRALFGDRARGRRRCPKCWYDMAGLPPRTVKEERERFVCPECGARSSARRNWRERAGAAPGRRGGAGSAGCLRLICCRARVACGSGGRRARYRAHRRKQVA